MTTTHLSPPPIPPHSTRLSIRDEDMDGEWEAPQVPNPACESAPGCGEWKRPMVDNPNYKGKWKPPMIDNPNYQVGLRLCGWWTVQNQNP